MLTLLEDEEVRWAQGGRRTSLLPLRRRCCVIPRLGHKRVRHGYAAMGDVNAVVVIARTVLQRGSVEGRVREEQADDGA